MASENDPQEHQGLVKNRYRKNLQYGFEKETIKNSNKIPE